MKTILRQYLHYVPNIGATVFIDPTSVVIGRVTLGNDVSVWPQVSIRGDVNYITIGARTNIQDGCILHVTHQSEQNPQGHPLIVGANVTVGHKVVLHGCTIDNHVLIGMGSIILDGAIIEENIIIGAGSLVPQNKRLYSGYLYLGSPAKQIRELTPYEIQEVMSSAERYVAWKNHHLQALSQ